MVDFILRVNIIEGVEGVFSQNKVILAEKPFPNEGRPLSRYRAAALRELRF